MLRYALVGRTLPTFPGTCVITGQYEYNGEDYFTIRHDWDDSGEDCVGSAGPDSLIHRAVQFDAWKRVIDAASVGCALERAGVAVTWLDTDAQLPVHGPEPRPAAETYYRPDDLFVTVYVMNAHTSVIDHPMMGRIVVPTDTLGDEPTPDAPTLDEIRESLRDLLVPFVSYRVRVNASDADLFAFAQTHLSDAIVAQHAVAFILSSDH